MLKITGSAGQLYNTLYYFVAIIASLSIEVVVHS